MITVTLPVCDSWEMAMCLSQYLAYVHSNEGWITEVVGKTIVKVTCHKNDEFRVIDIARAFCYAYWHVFHGMQSCMQ